MKAGVVLYGPPASGKDTITDEGGTAFALVPRLKAGPGRTAGYRIVTEAELATRRADPAEVLWETQRYAASYMLTRSDVLAAAESAVPVVHVGQPAAVEAVAAGVPELRWTVVDLRCPREVAVERIAARDTKDDAERLAIYDTTPTLDAADVVIDTSNVAPVDAARRIQQAVTGSRLVIPAPTFRKQGALDLDTTARYTNLLVTSAARYVLVNGPMGRGEDMNDWERAAPLAEWISRVPAQRIIAACWTGADLDEAQKQQVQQLVMLQAANESELARQIGAAPQGTWMYANPRYSGALVTPELARQHQVAGVKLSKVTFSTLRAMRETNPDAVVLHGSARNIETSLNAGADLVTTPPLTATPNADLGMNIQIAQQHIDSSQATLDYLEGHDARVDWITEHAQSAVELAKSS